MGNSFRITGGNPLNGPIRPQGAKNEALQVICAVLLTEEKVKISNVPNIIDIQRLNTLLENLGVRINRLSKNSFEYCAANIDLSYLEKDDFFKLAAKLRGSIMIVGPLLARFSKAVMPKPGGDKIGRRRLDSHLLGFEKLGAIVHTTKNGRAYQIEGKLKSADIHQMEASVTGTANIIMAASMAEGKTSIFNAACEPYIVQLCEMLKRMGVPIEGVRSNYLTIHGVKELKGTEHECLPDMIEIGSFMGLAALTQSNISIQNVHYKELGIIPEVFRRLGVNMKLENDDLHILAKDQKEYEIESFKDGSILTIADAPWPGFTPDLISIALVTAIQAKGSVLIHQKMFESRLFFVDKLIDMGAQIILCDPHRATVIGLNRKQNLRGIRMSSPDIRAGVALLIAALSAEGKSTIDNIEQIDRGYEDIDGRLKKLGALIERV